MMQVPDIENHRDDKNNQADDIWYDDQRKRQFHRISVPRREEN